MLNKDLNEITGRITSGTITTQTTRTTTSVVKTFITKIRNRLKRPCGPWCCSAGSAGPLVPFRRFAPSLGSDNMD